MGSIKWLGVDYRYNIFSLYVAGDVIDNSHHKVQILMFAYFSLPVIVHVGEPDPLS